MKLICLLLFAIAVNPAQNKSPVGDFTKSPAEHIIIKIDQPFVVRSIKGTVIQKESSREPLASVLFEIQGPGANRKIRRATTDSHGRFKIGHTLPGTCKFKATLNGFQSVMGNIVVSEKAAKTAEIKLEMLVGV